MSEERLIWLKDNEPYWREAGVDYNDFSTAVMSTTREWDFSKKPIVHRSPVPEAMKWLKDFRPEICPEEWALCSIGVIRGQIFVSSDMDDSPQFVAIQERK